MTYRSIFLADDWAHQAYFGWRVVADEPGLRILGKRRSVFERYLFLLTSEGWPLLGDQVQCLSGIGGLSDIIIHDFDGVLGKEAVVAGRRFRLAEQRERLLNIATIVIDLGRKDEEILAAMSSDYRRKIRKAEANGVAVDVCPAPDAALQEHFVGVFQDFATERGLSVINAGALAAMYRDGRGLLLCARKQGKVSNFLHLYKAGEAASFMYGVNLSKENDGAGQYLHWQAMRRLKADGVRWYDLGGVASTDPSDGIFNFKRKFGGELVKLGSEWRHVGILTGAANASREALCKLRAKRAV